MSKPSPLSDSLRLFAEVPVRTPAEHYAQGNRWMERVVEGLEADARTARAERQRDREERRSGRRPKPAPVLSPPDAGETSPEWMLRIVESLRATAREATADSEQSRARRSGRG